MSFDSQLIIALFVSGFASGIYAFCEQSRHKKNKKEVQLFQLARNCIFLIVLPIMSFPVLICDDVEPNYRILIIIGFLVICLFNFTFYWLLAKYSSKENDKGK